MTVVLVTGAGGYVGGRVAMALRQRPGCEVLPFGRKQADLRMERPFSGIDRERITHIVHAAAATTFGVDRDTAEVVNVQGARKVLDFARQCPNLQHVVLLSTVYASGLRSGEVPEARIDPTPKFGNWYEWSKWMMEAVALGESCLPVSVVRMPTVICDDVEGRVIQYNAFHHVMKLWFHRLLSVIPGSPDVPVHVTHGGAVVAAVVNKTFDEPGHVHNVALTADSVDIGSIIDIAHEEFSRVDRYRRSGVLRPLLIDHPAFARLQEGFGNTGSSVVSKALESLAPFAPQLYVSKEIVTNRRIAVTAEQLVRLTCRHLAEDVWSR